MVLVVICLLAGLIFITFPSVQARARDATREANMLALASQLEVYHKESQKYPALEALQDNTPTTGWVASNLKGFSLSDLIAPGDTVSTTKNSIVGHTATAPDQYGYVVAPTGCDNLTTKTTCVSYVLSWFNEASKQVKTKNSVY